MRRFSQRNSLVTLSDINITPLLDLAFVLLIIFIITTPLLEKGLDLNLPRANGQNSKVDEKDIRTVEIDVRGNYFINKRQMRLDQLAAQLAQDYKFNPNLVINIRGDGDSKLKDFVALADACVQRGISRYSIRTQPPNGK